jgi:hypothetical protein
METTPEVIAMGAASIKLFIDSISWLIPESKRKWIPLVALILWLGWAVAFFTGGIAEAISWGLTIWAGAIGINEVVGTSKKKD